MGAWGRDEDMLCCEQPCRKEMGQAGVERGVAGFWWARFWWAGFGGRGLMECGREDAAGRNGRAGVVGVQAASRGRGKSVGGGRNMGDETLLPSAIHSHR
eukprot:362520-Chlamydomonas_euryale.AAC.11